MENKSVFNTLNEINVNDKVEQKNGLNYLSWAYAWAEVKKLYQNAQYKIYERETENGLVNYFTDGKTCWVKTSVTIDGLEHIEMLPVMDFKNKSILLDNVTSFEINKSIQRSLTKALARHGLGLYIYAGEDLPENEADEKAKYEEAIARIRKVCADKKLKLADVMKEHKVTRDSNAEYINSVCDKLEANDGKQNN